MNTQYYKKPETDALLNKKASTESVDGIKNEVSVMKSSVQQMEGNVTALSGDVTRIEDIVNKINEKPSNTYEATYVDNVFSLLENGEVKNQFTIVGGGGSGADSTTITIERITPESLVVLLDAPTNIEFNFTSVDSAGDTTGNATAIWKVGNTKVATSTVVQGKNSFNITPHLKIGANTIRMTVMDSFGTISAKTWTVTVVEFKIESNFDDTLFYSNEVIFRYTPYGNISKQIVFKLDGEQIATIGTSVTGRQMTQTIPKKPHGAHLLEVYMTAEINHQSVKSNSIFKDIIWIEPENTTPIIGCSIKQFEVKQYNTYNIKYVIYDPEHNPSTITLYENEKLLSTLKVDRTGQTWSYKSASTGAKTLKIKCRETMKTLNVTVTELGIDIKPKLTGIIDIARLPHGALERCKIVADDVARFKLTTADVQTGDTVKVTGTGKMYFVKDDSKLSTEAGYEVYTAGSATSVPWSGVTGKPSTFAPSAHNQDISTINGLQAALDSKAANKDMTGATGEANGTHGLVPAPVAGAQGKYLRGDGTWQTPPNTTYGNATGSIAGLMSPADKTKLDNIAPNANNYVHPTTPGNKHIPTGGQAGQFLKWSADGTAVWSWDNNTTYGIATASTAGLVKSATGVNKVGVDGAGIMSVATVSTDTIVNGGNTLILNGGGAA